MHRKSMTVTSTGIRIGAAFMEPAPRPSADQELLQAALLTERAAHGEHVLDFIERHIVKAMLAIVALAFVAGVVKGLMR